MENIDFDMKMNDPDSFEEAKKLLDFLPDDDAVRTAYLEGVVFKLIQL